jgi:hypothetical protein
VEAISWKRIAQHVLALTCGTIGAIYLPLDNKDVMGWLVGAFTAFGGLLLAVMTLAGHSLTLLQGEDWQALQFFKNTYKTRILFSAFVSFLLIFIVILIVINYLCQLKQLHYVASFFLELVSSMSSCSLLILQLSI